MLVRKSGLISPSVVLVNRGNQCNYILGTERGILVDSCFSFEVDKLLARIQETGINPTNLYGIALTHLHPERIAGAAIMKVRYPHLQLILTQKMATLLSDPLFLESIVNQDCLAATDAGCDGLLSTLGIHNLLKAFSANEIMREGELLNPIKDMSIRVIATPGHTEHSVAFAVHPDQVLVTDEGCGYFRLKGFTANGGDYSIEENLSTLKRLSSLEISALAMPYHGALTGNLIRRHLKTVEEYTAGMLAECDEAFSSEMTEDEIYVSIRGAFYSDEQGDITSKISLSRTLDGVWTQIKSRNRQTKDPQSETTN